MAKICIVSGKKSQVGGRYSNRVRAAQFNPSGKVRRKPNFQRRTIFVPELNKNFRITLSTGAIRTLNKKGAYKTLKEAGVI